MTDAQLLSEAAIIKNETESGANTAERVGQMFEDIINNKLNYKVYTAKLTQNGQNDPEANILKNTFGFELVGFMIVQVIIIQMLHFLNQKLLYLYKIILGLIIVMRI